MKNTANAPKAASRHFGKQGKIFFAHFRDVRGTPEKSVETFHDDGQADILACMEAYRDIGFEGVLRPDHVPTMEGDNNDTPAYSAIGRLFAIGLHQGAVRGGLSPALGGARVQDPGNLDSSFDLCVAIGIIPKLIAPNMADGMSDAAQPSPPSDRVFLSPLR